MPSPSSLEKIGTDKVSHKSYENVIRDSLEKNPVTKADWNSSKHNLNSNNTNEFSGSFPGQIELLHSDDTVLH